MGVAAQEELDAIEAELLMDGEGIDAPGSDPEPEQRQEFMGGEQCGQLCSQLFAIVAARKGEQWIIKPEEQGALGGAMDSVLAKYIPATAEQYGPEIGLMVTLTAIVMPRMSRS